MTPTLHIATVGDNTCQAENAVPVREWLHRLAPARLRDIERLMAPAPHVLPAEVVGRGIDLQKLDRLTQDLTLDGLPTAIRRSSRSRRLGYLGGRLCAETALLALSGRCEAIGTGDGGAPRWPDGVVGSIAHTRDGAWAVVAASAEWLRVGIDSECIVDESGGRDIVALCCTPSERARWFPAGADPLRATLLFSAKESVYKAIHPLVKRFVEFDEMEWIDVSGNCESGFAPLSLRFRPTPDGPLDGRVHELLVQARVTGDVVHTSVAERRG